MDKKTNEPITININVYIHGSKIKDDGFNECITLIDLLNYAFKRKKDEE